MLCIILILLGSTQQCPRAFLPHHKGEESSLKNHMIQVTTRNLSQKDTWERYRIMNQDFSLIMWLFYWLMFEECKELQNHTCDVELISNKSFVILSIYCPFDACQEIWQWKWIVFVWHLGLREKTYGYDLNLRFFVEVFLKQIYRLSNGIQWMIFIEKYNYLSLFTDYQ